MTYCRHHEPTVNTMVILNQFEVTVPIDGKACEEVANEHTMDFGSVYIETVPGAHFEIQLAINPGFNFGRANYLRWEIFLNGESAVKSLCYRTEYQRDDCWRGSRGSLKERRDGRWYEKKFRFEDARIRENEPHDTDDLIRALKEVVWTIKVVIPRRIRRQNPEAQRDPAQTIGSVPLKAVKGQAITMSSTFGDAQPTEFITYHEGEDVDARPAATFVFKYRTKGGSHA